MRKWDKKTLNELKDYYSLMYERSSNDPFRQNEYYNTISSLNYIASLNTGLHIALPSKVKYVDVVNSDLGILSTYGHYCPILRTMQPYYDNYYIGNSNLKNVKSDPKKLLQVTDDFYEDFYDTITLSYREIRKCFTIYNNDVVNKLKDEWKKLSDKRKNECQQCQNEHSKSHQVFEIKMIIIH